MSTNLSKLLKEYMREHDMDKFDIAELIGVSESTIERWMYRGVSPTRESWKMIIKALGEPAREVMLRV